MRYQNYPTRNASHYFVVPNRIHSYKLSPAAYVICLYLCRSSPAGCKKLAEDLELSPDKVRKAVSELRSHKLVAEKEGQIYLNHSLLPNAEVKNCFSLPKEIFHLDLPVGAIAVYGFLLMCENRDTYQCYPSYQTIGAGVGMSKSTVRKYVECLIDRQLIYTEPTSVWGSNGRKRNGTLRYTIRPVYEAIQHYASMQMEQMSMFVN